MVAAAEDGHGIAQAMRLALQRADLKPEAVNYINAHGTSTPLNDRVETRAIHEVFGEAADDVMISSTKSMHAHMMGAAGAVEAAICVLTCHHGIVPPTINYEHPDPDCDLDYVPNEAVPFSGDYTMCNTFGFGGQNAVLLFRRA